MALGIPAGLGFLAAQRFGLWNPRDRLGGLAWSWVAGCLGVCVALMVASWVVAAAGVSWRGTVTLVLVLEAALLVFPRRRGTAEVAGDSVESGGVDWVYAIAVAIAVLITLEAVLRGSLSAVVGGDEGAFWSLRAKAIFLGGGFGEGYRELVHDRVIPHADYPPLNPLLQLWVFVVEGRVTHVANRLPIQCTAVALILAEASALRAAVREYGVRGVDSVLLFLLLGVGGFTQATRSGYADIFVALGALLALDGYRRFRATGTRAWLRLSALGLTTAVFAKHEGAILLGVCLSCALGSAALGVLRGRTRGGNAQARGRELAVAFGVPLLGLAVVWGSNWTLGVEFSRSQGAAGFEALGYAVRRIPAIASYAFHEVLLDTGRSQLVFLSLGLVLLLAPRWVRRPGSLLPIFVILLWGLSYVAILALLRSDVGWQLQTAAGRMAFHLVPAAILIAGSAIAVGIRELRTGAAPNRLRTVLPLVVVLVLGGRALFVGERAVLAFSDRAGKTVPEALSWDESKRMARALGRMDSRGGLPEGTHAEIVRAIQSHVLPGATVFEVVRKDNPLRHLLGTLRVVTFPIAYVRRNTVPSTDRVPGRDIHVLDFEANDAYLSRAFRVSAIGPGWKLWSLKVGPPEVESSVEQVDECADRRAGVLRGPGGE